MSEAISGQQWAPNAAESLVNSGQLAVCQTCYALTLARDEMDHVLWHQRQRHRPKF